MMDYGDIFKRGFQHTWNNKFIYLLGFLAALGGSGGSGGGSGGGNVNFPTGSTPGGGNGELEEFFRDFGFESANFESMISGIIGAAVAVVCILLIFRIVMWFIRLIAEGGMIHAVYDLENGQESNFKKAFADGRQHMLNFFMVNLIFFIIPISLFLILGAIVVIPLATSGGNIDETLIPLIAVPIVCLVCLMIPYSLITGLIYPIAQRGIIFKGLSGWDSIKYGWEFLKTHTSDTLIIALLLTVMGFIVGIISLIASLPILFATGWSAFNTLISGDIPSGGQFAILGVGIVLMMIISSIVNAVYISFRSSSFTLAYLELDGPKSPEPSMTTPTPDPAPASEGVLTEVTDAVEKLDNAVDVNTLKSD